MQRSNTRVFTTEAQRSVEEDGGFFSKDNPPSSSDLLCASVVNTRVP
jgi:hypothetical protein